MRHSAIAALLCGLSLTVTSCSLFKPKDQQATAYDPYGTGAAAANPYAAAPSNPYAQQPAASNPYGSYETPQTYTQPSSNPYTQPAESAPAYSGGNSGGGGKTHTVVRGDTLWSLSRKYNTSVTAIKSANNMSSDTLVLGKRVTIP